MQRCGVPPVRRLGQFAEDARHKPIAVAMGRAVPGAAKAARPGQFRRIWTSQRRGRARASANCTFLFADETISLFLRFD